MIKSLLANISRIIKKIIFWTLCIPMGILCVILLAAEEFGKKGLHSMEQWENWTFEKT